MASIFEAKPAADPLRAWRSVWALGLVICPVSYLCAAMVRVAPAPGGLAAAGIALFLGVMAASVQGYGRRVGGWEATLACVGVGASAGVGSYALEESWQGTAAFIFLVTGTLMTFIWVFLPWLSCDLAGAEYELRVASEPRAPVAPRSSLSFVIFTSLVLFGLGERWSRGEAWAPGPTPWLIALVALALGAMLLERLSFLTHSAREGNLGLSHRAVQRWVWAGLLVLLLAGLFAALGPYHPATPTEIERIGSAATNQPYAAAPSVSEWRQQLAAATAELSASARELPRGAFPLLLLLLLLLVAMVLVWLFQRSRAARWLLAAVSWLIARAIAVWRRLLAAFQRSLAPARISGAEAPAEAAWAQDPLFDVFDHPEVLAALSPREILISTYHLLLNFAEMLGHGRRHSETPLEYAESLRAEAEVEPAALRELTWGYVGVMYGEVPAPAPETVRKAWGSIAATLTAHLPSEELALRREAYLRRL